jgi:hypothetical protein
MAEQKRFKKKALNKDDHKAAENGAKAVKGVGGLLLAAVLVVRNKDNLKTVGKGIADVGKAIVKR